MYDFRDAMAKALNMELIVHTNPEVIEKDINPFDHGSALHTDIMKTQGLKQALDLHKFDIAFGGALRDEEKSRIKERIFPSAATVTDGPQRIRDQNYGTSTTVEKHRERVLEHFSYQTGLSWISGSTSIWIIFLLCHFILQLSGQWWSAMACSLWSTMTE